MHRALGVVRSRHGRTFFALALLAIGLVPVFQGNLTRPGDDYFFTSWDQHSQALVLGKIEQEASGRGTTPFGLVATGPDSQQSYTDLAALRAGSAPAATSYTAYMSSLGLQGHLFTGLYQAGCTSLNCLTTAESGLFSIGFVLFAGLIGIAVSRSFGAVFLVTGVLSPWVVSSAHNLYWVPWTWLLPAAAAAAACLVTTRRGRVVAFVFVGATVFLKSTMGYEFLTTVTALAAGVPLLARAFGRLPSWRRAFTLAAGVMVASIAGFVLAFVIHAAVVGGGDPFSGTTWILHDAARRTWGSGTDPDPLVTASLQANIGTVLGRYVFGWSTAVLAFGIGVGGYAIAAQGFWVLVLIPCVIAGVLLLRGDGRGRRYAVVLLVSAAPPLSWLVLAKSHAFAETNETYVLWYLPFVTAVVWVIVDAIRSSALISGVRRFASR